MSDKTVMAIGSQFFRPMLEWALPERCPCCGEITPAGAPFVFLAGKKLNFSRRPDVADVRRRLYLTVAMTHFSRHALRDRLAMTA